MKAAYLSIGLLTLLSPLTAAWGKDDREIFRIRDEIAAHETDPSATFYDILGIKQSASFDDITKAYRLKTKALHPDKVKQRLKAEHKAKDDKKAKPPSKAEVEAAIKAASEAQARLGLIANILKGPGRDRYDHFLSHGFPLWKGTDYYYDRYRPGLGTVLIGLFFVAGGGVHYLTLYMSWKRQKEFLERYIKFARETAWGGSLGIPDVDTTPVAQDDGEDEGGPPQPMNRKQRRMQEKESKKGGTRGSSKKAPKTQNSSSSSSRDPSAGPTGARKRVVAENGKILVVDSLGSVYLEDEDEDGNVSEFLLDPNELVKPTIWDTAVVRIPYWAFQQTMRLHFGDRLAANVEENVAEGADDDSDNGPAQNTPSSDSADEDFELVSKSTDSLSKAAKATGSQQGGKANKRKGRKR